MAPKKATHKAVTPTMGMGTTSADRRGPGGLHGADAAAAARTGRLSPAEVLADAAAREAEWEPWLGAATSRIGRVGAGHGTLAGVVAGVKDNIAVQGVVRGCGAPAAVSSDPQPADAWTVASITRAGASLYGTFELHPLALGVVTPQTRNPRAPDRIAGGSSGGVAAALAAGILHLGLGTDTGGSVRRPAACCGVTGLKTTRGLVPLVGVYDLAWSLDTLGPLAATVEDLALALPELIGIDPADPAGRPAPLLTEAPDRPLRIGVPRQLETMLLHRDVRDVWRSALDDLDRSGHTVVDVDLPLLPEAPRANGLVLCAEAAAMHRELLDQRPDDVPEACVDRLRWGAQLLAHDVADARRLGALLATQARAVFTDVDVLCTPTLACRVPRRGEIQLGTETLLTTQAMTLLTNPWNLIGVPAGTVPAGHDGDGGPVGIQLIGPWWGEYVVLHAMRAVEESRGGPWPTAPLMRPGENEHAGPARA